MQLSSITLLLTFTTISFGENIYQKMDHSLISPYLSNSWKTYGTTTVQPGYVRLTSDTKSQRGGISNSIPVMFRNWEVVVVFHVHGSGRTLFGDGFAFWYTEKPLVPGSAFGSWERFRGLGIFFDTYANQNGEHTHQHPYISAMVNDGNAVYDHDKDGTHTELAGCSSDFREVDRVVATIRYVKEQLTLTLTFPGTGAHVNCFISDNVRLPIGYYFGVSAATGDLSDNHDILSIRTYEVDVPVAPNESFEDWAKIEPSAGGAAPPRERVEDTPSASQTGYFWSLVYWLFLLACLVLVVVFGYKYYTRRQRNLKRLY